MGRPITATEAKLERLERAVRRIEQQTAFRRYRRQPQFAESIGYKLFIRCTLNSALTTSAASVAATITHQYGPGIENEDTSITVHNFLTSAAGVYLFEGDAGDAFLAFHDSGQNYRLDNGECP